MVDSWCRDVLQLLGISDIMKYFTVHNDRILEDHTSVSGVHSQTLENMKEKLMEMEGALQREREANSRTEVRQLSSEEGALQREREANSRTEVRQLSLVRREHYRGRGRLTVGLR